MSAGSLLRSIRADLSDQAIEALAARIAAMLAEPERPGRKLEDSMTGPALVDAATLSRRLGISRTWIYEHAVELGAIALGDGSRARLRFDPERALAVLESRRRTGAPQRAQQAPAPTHRRRRRQSPHAELLPVRGNGTRALLARRIWRGRRR